MNRRTIVCATALVLLVTGCSAQGASQTTVTLATATVTQEAIIPATVTVTVRTTVTPERAKPAAARTSRAGELAGPLGSRSDPLRPGTATSYGSDWTVTVGKSDTDAWPTIKASSDFADPPKSGDTYVSAPITVTYRGSKSQDPALDLQYAIVGSKGNVFESIDSDCGLGAPQGLGDIGELYGGASGKGTLCLEVPKDQLSGAVWRTEYFDTTSLGNIDGFYGLS